MLLCLKYIRSPQTPSTRGQSRVKLRVKHSRGSNGGKMSFYYIQKHTCMPYLIMQGHKLGLLLMHMHAHASL